ncbi:MAG TPA: LamG domain-containing protein, partial [Pseudomonadota bacterium]|nr:LamG domain-containing protein [Pseudomonadota bacterium]
MSLITLPPNYKSDTVKHINSITHEGKVLVFATDSAGRVWYTVKQDGFEDSSLKQNTTLSGWENLKELPFSEQNDDPSVLNKQSVENTYQQNPGQYLLRSRYRTTFSTALAPVQLVSALGHVYVFRQSPAGTLLVDRYVLDGMTNTLNLAFEVRYKRSRQKYVPNAAAAGTASAGTSPLDTLDFYDSDGTPFIAPTTELCLVNGLQNGWFSVVFVPTSEPDVYRWHIFAFNHATGKIELTTLRASEEGLFDIKDYTLFEQSDGNTTSRLIPGIIRRQIEIDSFSINNGFAATKYDLQTEQRDKNGEKLLLKTATRILLAVPGAYQDRKSLQFDGESAYVEVPYHADLNSPQFSAACLARSEGGFGVRTVMGSNGEGCGYLLGLSAENRWQFALATAQGWVGCVAPLSATLGVFTQLVGTYDGATLRLYVNGVEAASTPAADYTPASSQPLRIGAGSTGTQPAYPFPGKIAGAAVWSRALSPAEIGAMGTQHSAYPNVLQGYYALESVGDHGFGTLDQSGHNYHGSLVGPVRVSENVEPRAAALSFAIASDGTLSQLGDAPTATVIRSTQREILLPLSTLEEVKSYASVVPALQGAISGFAVGGDAESAQNLVLINTDGAADLANNDQVEISGTQNYQGVYAITKIDENRLKIQIPVGQNLGAWRRPENLDNGLLFDGKITSYQRTAGGELTITCPHHGMETGDAVQITGTESYNQTFSVVKIDNNRFAINRPWPLAEGVNVGQRLARRRGLVFDGSARVTLSLAEPATEVTHELWFKTSDPEAGLLQVAAAEDATRGCDRHLFLAGGNLRARIYNNEVIASAGPNLADGRWHHAAHVFGRSVGGQKLYVDGVLVASGEKASSDFDWRDRIQLGYSYDAGSPYLRGQLAEVRVWKQARSAAAIANNRYLQLRGNEVDLIGYWRLGAVVDGTVLDLSPSAKHGTISGNAYVSAITLNRTLQDGSAVIKYSNADLVAVSQHCVYEESFEFRVISTTPIDPMNVDGQGRKLFAFSHWGK